jgi:hypothetical protein
MVEVERERERAVVWRCDGDLVWGHGERKTSVSGLKANIVVGVTLLSTLGDFKRLARILIGSVGSMGDIV